MAGKINWDEVFEKYTKDKVLQKNYSAIARELGVSEAAVRKQFRKRGVIDPRRGRGSSSKGSNLKFNSNSNYPKWEKYVQLRPNIANNLKHGLYARVFWSEAGRQIYKKLVESGSTPDLRDAIYMLKAKIASGEINKVKDVLNALEIMSKLYDKILGAERNEIERQRLQHEAERVAIMREKLELEKAAKNITDEDEIELVLGDSDENPDKGSP